MKYGNGIGKKFYEDGSVRRFPGNTVVAPIQPGCSAYDVMVQLRQMVIEAGLDDHLILLPVDSYHMTVLDCVVDENRGREYWPAALSTDCSLEEADDYISAAVATVPNPGPVRMKFDQLGLGANCAVVRLLPADETEEKKLWDFRDGATQAMGLHTPQYSQYRFHISLGYVRIIPDGEAEARMKALAEKINGYIARQPAFETGVPYMAYFDDMMAFSPSPIPR